MPQPPSPTMLPSILIVEDHLAQLETINDILIAEGFQTIPCPTAAEAFTQLEGNNIGMVVVDLCLPDIEGIDFLNQLRTKNDRLQIIIYTEQGSLASAKAAIDVRAMDYLEKADNPSDLVHHVHQTMEAVLIDYSKTLEEAIDHSDHHETLLKLMVEGTAASTGQEFFNSLVKNLAKCLDVKFSIVAYWDKTEVENPHARTLSFWQNNDFGENYTIALKDCPCGEVRQGNPVFYPHGVPDNFPQLAIAKTLGIQSYLGFPMATPTGELIGHLAIFDTKPMAADPIRLSIMKIFAARAAAELERKKAEEALRDAHDSLEDQVKERTKELSTSNTDLKKEIEERLRVEQALIGSKERFALAVKGTDAGIWDWDVKTNKVYFSPRWKGQLGYEEDEIQGEFFEWENRLHPEDRDRALHTIKAYLEGQTPQYELEHRLQCKDGTYRWILARGVSLTDEAGKPYRMAGSHIDITDRKKAEEAKATLEWSLSQGMEGFALHDTNGNFLYANPAEARIYGYETHELIGQSWKIQYEPHEIRFIEQECFPLLEAEGKWQGELVGRKKTGEPFDVEISLTLLKDSSGQATGLLCTSRDITERKEAKQNLQRFEAVLEATTDLVGMANKDGQVLYINLAGRNMLGLSDSEDLSQFHIPDFHPPWATMLIQNEGLPIAIQKGVWSADTAFLHKNGQEISTSQVLLSHKADDGSLDLFTTIARDITERKHTELEIAERELLLSLMLNTGPGCIKRVAADGTLLSMNPAGLELIEVSDEQEVLGLSVFDLVTPEHRLAFEAMHQRVIEGHPQTLEFEVQGLKGTKRWMETHAVPFHNPITNQVEQLAVTHSITERKQSELFKNGQKEILELIAGSGSLFNILQQICQVIETQSLNLMCSILLLEGDTLYHGAAPSLPATFTTKIDGIKIGEQAGSCGTAAFLQKPILTSDIATDPLWEYGRGLALRHGLKACWSTPIFSSKNLVLGTFAIYYPLPQSPEPQDQELINAATNLAGIAIERRHAEDTLQTNEQSIRELYEISSASTLTFDQQLSQLLKLGTKRFGLPIGIITQINGDYFEILGMQAPQSPHEAFTSRSLVPISRSYCRLLLDRDDPLSFEHASQSDLPLHPPDPILRREAYLGTKIWIGESLFGTLSFSSQTPYPRTITVADKDFLQLMARWIGGELARRQAEKTLQTSESAIRNLYEITSDQSLTFKQQLTALLQLGCQRFNLSIGFLTQLRGDMGEIVASHSTVMDLPVGTTVPIDESLCEVIFQSQTPVSIEHTATSPFATHPGYKKFQWETFLGTKVLTGDTPSGTLCFASPAPSDKAFADADRDFLQLMARWIGGELARHQTEEALQDTLERWDLAVTGSYDGLWEGRALPDEPWHVPHTPVWWSPRFKELLGFEASEFPHVLESWTTRLHPEDKDAVFTALFAHIDHRQPFDVEYRLLTKQGEYRWFSARGQAVWDDQGNLLRMAGSLRDITEKRNAEESLKRWALIFGHTQWGVAVSLGTSANLELVNPAFAYMHGYTVEELNGKPLTQVYAPEEHEKIPGYIQQVEDKGYVSFETTHIRKDGTTFPVLLTVFSITNQAGTSPYRVANVIDLTERKRSEEALHEMNLALAHAMPGISQIDHAGSYLTINQLYANLMGYEPEELIGQSWEPTVHPEDLHLANKAYETMLNTGKGEFEARAIRKDRSIFYKQVLMVKADPLKNPGVSHHRFMRDISERKNVEATLQVSEQSIRELYEITSSQLTTFDQKIRTLLSLGCKRFGLPISTLTKRIEDHLELEFLHAPDQTWSEHALVPICDSFCGKTITRSEPLIFEDVGQTEWKDTSAYRALGLEAYIGTKVMVGDHVYGSLCFLDRQPYSGKYTPSDVHFLQLMARWIGGELERRQSEEALHEANERLLTLSQQLLTVQETERRQLARDLHDEIGQTLTAVKINLHNLQQGKPAALAPGIIQDSLQILDQMLKHVRELSLDLRPSMLDDLGLVAAVRWFVNRQAERAGWTAEITIDEHMPTLSPDHATTSFRVIQEALTNVMRHAQATHITIHLQMNKDHLELFIGDNGVGFDSLHILKPGTPGKSFGLISMQERVRLLNGQLIISSQPGKGTQIQAHLPIATIVKDPV